MRPISFRGLLRRIPGPARVPILLYAVALALRLIVWRSPIYGDEAWHFLAARRLFDPPTNIRYLTGDEGPQLQHLFLWRPLFEAILAPAALVSFEAWRLAHLTLTATTPVWAFLTLRTLGVKPILSLAAAVALLIDPLFLAWGIVVFPDGLLTVAIAAALWAHSKGRSLLAAGLLLAAMWIKESALVAVGVLAADVLLRSFREGRTGLNPPRLATTPLLYLSAGLVGLVPLAYYLSSGGQPPGWVREVDGWVPLERLVVHLVFLPVLLVGLLWRRTRWLAALPLAYTAFYLLLTFQAERHIEAWYYVLPAYLALLAAALTLDEAATRTSRLPRAAARRTLAGVAIVLSLLLLTQAILPVHSPVKGTLTHPLSHSSDRALWEEVPWLLVRGNEEEAVFGALAGRRMETVALVDMGWFFALHPFSEQADVVRQGYMDGFRGTTQDFDVWTRLVEEEAEVTAVHKVGIEANEALRETYQSCSSYENSLYLVIEGPTCGDRRSVFEQRYASRTAA